MPVIVVRPTSKRDKARSKRANDPDRQGYRDILAKSESLIDVNSPRNSFFANEEEAAAVGGNTAAHKPSVDTHPLAQVARPPESESEDDEPSTSNLEDPKSPAVLMKSPHLQNLDSPDLSEASLSSDEEDQGGVSTRTTASSGTDLTADTTGLVVSDEKQNEEGAKNSMSYVESIIQASQDAHYNSQQPDSAPHSPKSGPVNP